MAIKDVERIYNHDGDLVKVILELTYSSCESPDLRKDKARHGKVSAEYSS